MPASNKITPQFQTDTATCGPAMQALSQAHRCFVICLVQFGNTQAEAARRAGFSDTGDSAKATGHRLAHDPRIQAAIIECSLQLVRSEGAASIRTLVKLRDTATDEKVRLRAAQDILDRCGGLSTSVTSQHLHEVTFRHEYTLAELDARRLELEKQLGIASTLPALRALPTPIDAEFEEVDPDLADLL